MPENGKIIIMFSMYVLLWIAAGCSTQEHNVATRQGYVDVTATVDAIFLKADGSKATLDPAMVPLPDSLAFTLSGTGSEGEISHAWPTLAQFNLTGESYMAGEYIATLMGKAGYNAPLFAIQKEFTLLADSRYQLYLQAVPAQCMLAVNIENSSSSPCALKEVSLGTSTELYHRLTADADSILFVSPGQCHVLAKLESNGNERIVSLETPKELEAAHYTHLGVVNLGDGTLSLSMDNFMIQKVNTLQAFTATAPTLSAIGFNPEQAIEALEGLTLENPVIIKATASRESPFKHLYLTINSPLLPGFHSTATADILNLSAEQQQLLESFGFKWQLNSEATEMTADFTALIEELSSTTTATSRFQMVGVDVNGIATSPMTLTVNTQVVNLNLTEISTATVGVDIASVSLMANTDRAEQSDFSILTTDDSGEYTVKCPIVGFVSKDRSTEQASHQGLVNITFRVPSGLSNVPLRIDYLNQPRLEIMVQRVNPNFSLDIDGFATTAIVNIANLSSADVRDMEYVTTQDFMRRVTSQLSLTVNGKPANVWKRDNDNGILIINGLQPETNYSVESFLSGTVPCTMGSFDTEKATPVPANDFSDWKTIIDYKNMPQGGRFSATSAAIVNRQNYTNVQVNWLKKSWASLNALTFYSGSKRHNSWYMQPSAWLEQTNETGIRAICLRSVGYDHNGPEIPDYIQQPGQSLDYSMAVPHVSNFTSGMVWLGEYSYSGGDNTGVIKSGVAFTSRPSSLNGYFKYIPDLTDSQDYGLVCIQLVNIDRDGKETEVASGQARLSTSPDFRSFNVTLEYREFDLHPTHLRLVMYSSHYGAEGGKVPVTAMPAQGAMLGSTLWISNLTFSY